jgi:hypothetical protein
VDIILYRNFASFAHVFTDVWYDYVNEETAMFEIDWSLVEECFLRGLTVQQTIAYPEVILWQ